MPAGVPRVRATSTCAPRFLWAAPSVEQLPSNRPRTGPRSDGDQWLMRFRGKLDGDLVTRPHRSAVEHDPHHAGLSDQPTVLVAVEHCRHQTGLNSFELRAWIAESGDLDDGVLAEA